MWTNTSLPPSCGMMNPYPLVVLNHLTVPVAMSAYFSVQAPCKITRCCRQPGLWSSSGTREGSAERQAKIRLHVVVGTESTAAVNHTGDIQKNRLTLTVRLLHSLFGRAGMV